MRRRGQHLRPLPQPPYGRQTLMLGKWFSDNSELPHDIEYFVFVCLNDFSKQPGPVQAAAGSFKAPTEKFHGGQW